MRVFSADQAIIEAGSDGTRIMFAMAFLIGAQVVSGGLYQALGNAKPALILSMSRKVFILIPLILILPQFFGAWGVWIAFSLVYPFSLCTEIENSSWRKRKFVWGVRRSERD